jgi:hypothetical protein
VIPAEVVPSNIGGDTVTLALAGWGCAKAWDPQSDA